MNSTSTRQGLWSERASLPALDALLLCEWNVLLLCRPDEKARNSKKSWVGASRQPSAVYTACYTACYAVLRVPV